MTEQSINFERMEYALTLFGNSDENIRMLEQGYGVSVVFRGTDIKVSGDAEKVMTCTRCIEGLLKMVESGEELSAQNIRYMMSLVEEGREQEADSLGRDVICITAKGKPLKPKTIGQQKYVEAIRKNTIVMGIGPAGTGKTYLAVAMAVKAFRAQEVNRIVLTRPAVEAGEKLGFLPGDLQNKVDPYLRPLYDALFDMLGAENFQKYQERGNIEVAPLAYMRGRTLDDSFIILDEAQNTTPEQMKMFLTRLGFNSKAIITGDVTQIDLPDARRSGLVEASKILRDIPDIAICRFTEKDVVRHRPVQDTIKTYEKIQQEGYCKEIQIMDKLKVIITNDQKAVKIPAGLRLMLRRCCTAVLRMEHFEGDAEVNITFTDDEKIREMNNRFRQKDAATDVLSFPLGENGQYDLNPDTGCKQLGDIVISVEHAVAQAAEFGHTFDREMGYLTVHSMLHLLGYDHVNGGLEKTIMREKEEEALARLGLTRDNTYVE